MRPGNGAVPAPRNSGDERRMSWKGLPESTERRLRDAAPADFDLLDGVARELSRCGTEWYQRQDPREAAGPTRDAVRMRRLLAGQTRCGSWAGWRRWRAIWACTYSRPAIIRKR
jgi:hypothetical protein